MTHLSLSSISTPTPAPKYFVSIKTILLRIATWLREEDALPPLSLCVVVALKDNWLPRLGKALHGDDYTMIE